MNHVRDYMFSLLSENNFEHDDNGIGVLSIIDNKSQTIKKRDVEIIGHEISNLRIGIYKCYV